MLVFIIPAACDAGIVASLTGLFIGLQVLPYQEDLHIAVPVSWDRKDVIFKNKPEKLLKTKGKATWIAKNEPENEAEKLLKTRSCGKNEPKTNRKTKRAILLKIQNSQN